MIRLLLAAVLLAVTAAAASAQLGFMPMRASSSGALTPCSTNLVFDQTVACNAVSVALMGK